MIVDCGAGRPLRCNAHSILGCKPQYNSSVPLRESAVVRDGLLAHRMKMTKQQLGSAKKSFSKSSMCLCVFLTHGFWEATALLWLS